MPADSNLPNLPIRRLGTTISSSSTGVTSAIRLMRLTYYYLANIDFPVSKPCDTDEDCPPGTQCFNGYCVESCNGGVPCPEGFICVDVLDSVGGVAESVCVQYPFPCDSLDQPEPCPPGYVCYNGFCFKLCDVDPDCPGDSCCPEGSICVYFDAIGESICVPYPFPCSEEIGCPTGFVCYNGQCVRLCNNDCPDGFECVIIDTTPGGAPISACLPIQSLWKFRRVLPDPCPPDFYCYNGMCYPICNDDVNCPDGFSCQNVGNINNNEGSNGGDQISICLPDPYNEGLINDGKLNILDDQNNRRTIFTANQYGDTFLKFNGIDIDGENGGGSGGTLTFNTLWERVDTDVKESDIEPKYENVDVLPHGTSSNVGNDTTRWDGLFTHDLHIDRDVYGTLRPHADLAWNIGEDGRRWGTTFTQDFNITRDVYGTLKPNAEDTWQIGEEGRKWKSGHFGVGGSVHLNPEGSIGLGSAAGVGAPFQILTSNGAGQAFWDFIHLKSRNRWHCVASKVIDVSGSQVPSGGIHGLGIWSYYC